MKTLFSHLSLAPRTARWLKCGMAVTTAAAILLAAAASASARPVISHDPVLTAVKGEPLGLRATVRDAGGRISSVSVFYASSRGMTPFRRDLSTTGAGIWYGTIPGHLIGPGSNLFYYVHADNIEGDSTDTEWVTVNVIEPGMSAADMPTVQAVARESQLAAAAAAEAEAAATEAPADAPVPAQPASKPVAKPATKPAAKAAPKPASRNVAPSAPESSASAPVMATAPASARSAAQDGEEASSGRNKYLLPVAIGVGAAAVIGGAVAIANNHSGGGGGGSKDSDSGNSSSGTSSTATGDSSATATGTVTNGNYGGSFSLCFEPAGTGSNALTHCESGIVSLYVENSTVSIVGIWDTEMSATLVGNTFTAESALPARGDFPDARIIVAGGIGSSSADARIVGSSTDTSNPGNFTGNISATRR